MRALNKGWIGIALIILFGASLFFFRGSSRYSNLFNSDNFVANVSGTSISTTQFMRSLEMNIGQFAQMIGEDLTGDQIRAFQIHQLVLQNLVNNAIFENEFDSKNYILDDTTIAERTQKRFPNLYLNNKINDDALSSFLRQQRLKIQDLVNIVDYETRAEVFDDLFFEINYPSELSEKISMINNQSRLIDLLKVPYDKIKLQDYNIDNLSKDNAELISYFEQNNTNYISKEKRDISYLVINKKNYEDNFVPNQNEIVDYFNNNKKIYTIPEKRSFKQFNFKTQEEAEDFKIEITGLSNDEILKLILDKNIKFNEFKDVNSNQVLDELSDVIFALNIGQISEIVNTTLAHHIIILDKIDIEKVPMLNDVSEKIKTTLTMVKLDNYFNDLKSNINQKILDGFSIIELSNEYNLSIENINNVALDSENENNLEKYVIDLSFSQNKDFISDIYDFDENISLIINVDNIYPSKVEDLESVYEIVLNDFINSKKLEFAQNLFDNNKNDNNLIAINSIFNLEIEELNTKLNSNDITSILNNSIVNSELNKINFSSDEKNIYFFKVKKIIIPQNIDKNQNINLLADLKNAFGNEIIKTKNISFNDELINGLLSQYK